MEPFLGEIRLFCGNFAPRGWALCDGQLLPIAQNDALFAIIGTLYGGDGQVTFALPDLRGRTAIHAGQAPGLSARAPGQSGGAETVALTPQSLPAHTHPLLTSRADATTASPAAQLLSTAEEDIAVLGGGAGPGGPRTGESGGGQPHDNLPPQLAVNYIIALEGIFPARG